VGPRVQLKRSDVGRLEGKAAIVTGGSRGIGRATVEKLAAEGAGVVFLDLDAGEGERVAKEIGNDRVSFVRADVTREGDVARAVGVAAERHGTVDVLVNNAGINAYFDAAAMTEADWDSVFAVDLKGAWLCCKHVLPIMRRARRGSIVNIASIHARLTIAGMFPYAAAKSGLVGLTRGLALDCGRDNIRVNAVLPGYTRTRLVDEWLARQPDPRATEATVLAVIPMGRIASPAEIANLIAFVASDEASAITGASLAADCGLGIRFAS
jgi:NAD(P)-dependent dehydrogenase (short-subunit alcohol dehydrogenase family)